MITRVLLAIISLYQKKGGGSHYFVECNFTPSCSEYAEIAICRHGPFVGLKLSLARLRRCNDRNLREKVLDQVPDVTHQ